MPARLKIRVLGGRSLPVMDKSSDTSDAFVEVKIGNWSAKTEVCRHSLNPVWNSEWFKFEVPDEELQDEPLQIRIMDYDTYSANDAIGKVYINLNPLLGKECGHTMWGFFPIYDTMHGTRGEIYCVIKMEPFSDSNRFRQTSCGVRFFHSPTVPSGYQCTAILGFLEELVVNDDPEYQWIDKIRTPRASNEARQTLFLKLSGEVQRKIGLKALDLGGNAVLGYQLCFDLEGESGIVVRGIGTAVMLNRRDRPPDSKRTHNTSTCQPSTDESGCGSPCTERSHSPVPNPPVAFLESIEAANHVTTVPPMQASQIPQLISPLPVIPSSRSTCLPNKSLARGRQSPTPIPNASTSGHTLNPNLHTTSSLRRSHSPCYKTQSCGVSSRSERHCSGRLLRTGSSPVPAQDPYEISQSFDLTPVSSACRPATLAGESNTHELSAPANPSHHFATSPIATQSINTHHRHTVSESEELAANSYGSTGAQQDSALPTPQYKFMVSAEGLHMLEYPFITMKQFPAGLVRHIGGLISSRSVKHLAQINSPDDPETRDGWWMELRKEIRSHCRLLSCNAVLGYTESSCICDDVVILSASGTAAILNTNGTESYSDSPIGTCTMGIPLSSSVENPTNLAQTSLNCAASAANRICSLCHVCYSDKQLPFNNCMFKCALCSQAKVPDILLSSIEPPLNFPTSGLGCLIQARVFRHKKDTRGEQCAKELSDSLPFLEYELHKQLLSKLKMKGMNALFGLNVQISVGENMLIAIATGTGVFATPLPSPTAPLISSSKGVRSNRLNDIQKIIYDSFERNKLRYEVLHATKDLSAGSSEAMSTNPNDLLLTSSLTNDRSTCNALSEKGQTDTSDEEATFDSTTNVRNFYSSPHSTAEPCVVLEVDDSDDADIISLLVDSEVPKDYEMCTTDHLPGDQPFLCIYQTFTKVFRAKVTNLKQFSTQFDWIIQSLFVKLRRLIPCAMAGLRFRLDAPEADFVQVVIFGSVAGLRTYSNQLMCNNSASLYLPTHCYQDRRRKLFDVQEFDGQLIVEEEPLPRLELPASISSVHDLPNRGNPACVELTTLSYLPGCSIIKYMGNLVFPFIRETTSVREAGGLNGFLASFLNEVHLIVRTHIVALDGNALLSMGISQCVLLHNPHKNQAQCLVIISGDVVKAVYGSINKVDDKCEPIKVTSPLTNITNITNTTINTTTAS